MVSFIILPRTCQLIFKKVIIAVQKCNKGTMQAAHEHYQYKPFDGSSHFWAQGHLSALSSDAKVLDIGAGSGFAGSFLKDKGLTELYAVEIEPQAVEHLKLIYKDVAADVSKYQGMQFDVILLLDILEHLVDPASFLAKLEPYLSKDGMILISVPNVAHWSVRIPLLFGIFNYHERGILDSSHLVFFTRSSFKRFIKNSPFFAVEYSQSIVPFQLLLQDGIASSKPFSLFSSLRKILAKILPGLFAYQHLVVIKKAPNN